MIRVVKVGGRVQSEAALPHRLGDAAAAGPLVVVHGGGDEVSALQRTLGNEPRFVGGRRATTPDELEVVRMVLSGTTNKRLVRACAAAGVRAVGVSGEDGGLLRAHVAPGAPLGRVGERVECDPTLLRDLLAAGWLPMVSPVSADADGPPGAALNVNGDDAAAAIAAALEADELVFVADVAGVLVDGAVVRDLSRAGARDLIARNVAQGGMAAKLEAAMAACERGVARVRITALDALADADRGTVLHSTLPVSPWPQ